jgi:hypothetical protein
MTMLYLCSHHQTRLSFSFKFVSEFISFTDHEEGAMLHHALCFISLSILISVIPWLERKALLIKQSREEFCSR